MTVAYVTAQARDVAAFLASAGTEIVMDNNAQLGDFQRLLQARPNYRNAVRDSLAQLAEIRGHSRLLVDGMFDPKLEVYRARNQKRPDEWQLMDGKTLQQKNRNAVEWRFEGRITFPIRAKLGARPGAGTAHGGRQAA